MIIFELVFSLKYSTLPRLEGWQVMHSLPYSEAITEDVYGDLFKSVGRNEDGDGLNTIKLLTLYSVKEREPLAFAKQSGNVPDVISIENALTQLKCFSLEKPLIVTDNGPANSVRFILLSAEVPRQNTDKALL